MPDDGRIIVQTDEGNFIYMAGSIHWAAPGAEPAPMGAAPAAALMYAAWAITASAHAAVSGCGAEPVGSALAAIGIDLVLGRITQAASDVEFLLMCLARGMDEPYPE
jgi:hypothetical protein